MGRGEIVEIEDQMRRLKLLFLKGQGKNEDEKVMRKSSINLNQVDWVKANGQDNNENQMLKFNSIGHLKYWRLKFNYIIKLYHYI